LLASVKEEETERSEHESLLATSRTRTGLEISHRASHLSDGFNASSMKRPRSYTDSPSTTTRNVIQAPFDDQYSATPTPSARRYNVGTRGADVTPVATDYSTFYERDPVSHSEQEHPIARKATRDSSDTEEIKYVPASPEVEDIEANPHCSVIEKLESVRTSPEFEELDSNPDCSDAKQASPEIHDEDDTSAGLDTEKWRSTRNTADIEVLEATPRCSDTQERTPMPTFPEAEELEATLVSGEAEDHDTGTKALPDGIYEIEGLRGRQWSAGKLWLKIKWKNLPTPSWELADHMRNELGEEDYEELLQTKPRKRRKKAPKW
jgi:hypothetical protein